MPFLKGLMKKDKDDRVLATLEDEVAAGKLQVPSIAVGSEDEADEAPAMLDGPLLAEDGSEEAGDEGEAAPSGDAADADDMSDLLDDIFGDDGAGNEELHLLVQGLPAVPVQEIVALTRDVQVRMGIR